MPIFTFSTPDSEETSTEVVKSVKALCKQRNIKFSGLIVSLLREWHNKEAKELSHEQG